MHAGSDSTLLVYGRTLFLSVVLLLCVGMARSQATASGPLWSVNERLNDDTGTLAQNRPAIAIDSSRNAFAIWRDLRNGTYNGHLDQDIYFSYRPAGGDWSVNQRVNDDQGIEVQDWPAIAVDSEGNAYAVWKDYRNGDPDVFFSYRPAGGAWAANQRVDDGGTANLDDPDIAADAAGNLYAVWQDWRNGDPDVYFSYRPAGGCWGPDERVSDAITGTAQYPASIAVDGGGNAYAVWTDLRNFSPDIYFSYRPAGGSWSANERVDHGESTAQQWSPAIAVDDAGNAYALWQDNRNGNSDVYSSDRPVGGSWGTDMRVNDDTGEADQLVVAIGLRGNTVMAVWRDERNGVLDIYASYRLDGGGWSANERINDNSVNSRNYPAIDLDAAGGAYAVWSDERNGDADVYFSYRQPSYAVFLPIVLKTS